MVQSIGSPIINFAQVSSLGNADVDSEPGNNSTSDVMEDDEAVAVIFPNGDAGNQTGDFDLALNLSVFSQSSTPLIAGSSTVTFAIEVFNQGGLDAFGIEITDYLPTSGLVLNDSNWTVGANGFATYNFPVNVPAGASQQILITFDADASASGTFDNFAEISAGSDITQTATDIDSNPDNINNDLLVDDVLTDDGTLDEDDHDIASVQILSGTGTTDGSCLLYTSPSPRDS